MSSGTQAVITLNISSDALTEGTEKFRVRIREGSITGPIVGTSEDITISDTSTSPGGDTGSGGGDDDDGKEDSVGEFTLRFKNISLSGPITVK